MATLTPASLPPAEHSIKVEIISKLDEVKIDELELGDEYPALYHVLELFPSLAGNAIKQRLSLESQMTCKAKRNAVSGMLGVQFNDCRLTHNKSGALWNAAAHRLAELCSADLSLSKLKACSFLFSPTVGKTPGRASFPQLPQAQCQWQGDNRHSQTAAAAADATRFRTLAERRRENLSNHLATRPYYILSRLDQLRYAKFVDSESLQNKNEPAAAEHRAGQLWSEFLFGGSLPTHGSDGVPYKIKVRLLSQPEIRSAGLSEVLCAARAGHASVEFSKIALNIEFSKNKFRLKGNFSFSQKISGITASEIETTTQALRKRDKD